MRLGGWETLRLDKWNSTAGFLDPSVMPVGFPMNRPLEGGRLCRVQQNDNCFDTLINANVDDSLHNHAMQPTPETGAADGDR